MHKTVNHVHDLAEVLRNKTGEEKYHGKELGSISTPAMKNMVKSVHNNLIRLIMKKYGYKDRADAEWMLKNNEEKIMQDMEFDEKHLGHQYRKKKTIDVAGARLPLDKKYKMAFRKKKKVSKKKTKRCGCK
jgi:hypothetical protein